MTSHPACLPAEHELAPDHPGVDALLLYRTLFDQTAMGAVVADGDRRILRCNPAYCRILGRPRDQVEGRSIADFNVPGDPDECPEAMAALAAGAPSRTIEKRYLRPDGATTSVRVTLSLLSRDDDLYAGLVEDIDDRERAEHERASALSQLHEHVALLERAHEVARLGTFVIDPQARTGFASAALARMIGAGDQPLELPLEEFRRTFGLPEDGAPGGALDSARPVTRRDGRVIWVASSSSADADAGADGRPRRMFGVIMDVSERVALIDELRSSRARIIAAAERERLRVERDLHDGAQQILVAIRFKLERAREEVRPDARDARLREIGEDVEAAIEELRALAHGIHPAVLRDYGLDDALRSLARQEPGRVRIAPGDPVGRCAPPVETAIYFCAREALQNAMKHAGAGALVTISLRRRGDDLELEVTDDGSGFDVAGHEGALGLAGMRDRIGAHGGMLEILSAPGAGTTVRARLPAGGG